MVGGYYFLTQRPLGRQTWRKRKTIKEIMLSIPKYQEVNNNSENANYDRYQTDTNSYRAQIVFLNHPNRHNLPNID